MLAVQLELLDAVLSAVRKELKSCLEQYLPEVPHDWMKFHYGRDYSI